MTGIYDPPAGSRPPWAPPDAPPPYSAQQPYGWPGPGGPGGPYDPYGYGRGGPNGPFRRLRRQLLALVAVVVIAVASFWGLEAARGHHPAAVQSPSAIAAKVDGGLVDIVTTLGFQRAQAAGTGIVLTSSGEILTNNHVIEGATSIQATDVGNGRTYRARVVGYDRSDDVAVLKLQGASGLETVATGNSASADLGQKVVALGNAGGKGGTPSVVTGRIIRLGASVTATDGSAGTSETLHGMIGHNAPIRPGDSGGPLVTLTGRVIGMNTAASTGSNFQLRGPTQAFAIPINKALSIARQIEAGAGSASVHIGATAFLGIGVLSAQQAQVHGVQPGSGALIGDVFPGTAASAAGLTPGDVIVAAGGQRVTSPDGLQAVFGQHHPGDRVGLTWVDQNGARHSAPVTLKNGPAG